MESHISFFPSTAQHSNSQALEKHRRHEGKGYLQILTPGWNAKSELSEWLRGFFFLQAAYQFLKECLHFMSSA